MINEVKLYRLQMVEDNPADFVLLKRPPVEEIINTKTWLLFLFMIKKCFGTVV